MYTQKLFKNIPRKQPGHRYKKASELSAVRSTALGKVVHLHLDDRPHMATAAMVAAVPSMVLPAHAHRRRSMKHSKDGAHHSVCG